jgi:hypothetical protein
LTGEAQWPPPLITLPSEEDTLQDKKCLIDKLRLFLSRKNENSEKRYLAMYLQGRLEILEEANRSILEGGNIHVFKPSLEHILWKSELPEPSMHEQLGRGSSALVFKAMVGSSLC